MTFYEIVCFLCFFVFFVVFFFFWESIEISRCAILIGLLTEPRVPHLRSKAVCLFLWVFHPIHKTQTIISCIVELDSFQSQQVPISMKMNLMLWRCSANTKLLSWSPKKKKKKWERQADLHLILVPWCLALSWKCWLHLFFFFFSL